MATGLRERRDSIRELVRPFRFVGDDDDDDDVAQHRNHVKVHPGRCLLGNTPSWDDDWLELSFAPSCRVR